MTDFGKIKSYDAARGTGTITPEKGGDALPFGKADMQQEGEVPAHDARYGYDTQTGDNGRRHAVNLQSSQQEQDSTQQEQASKQAG